ncbi:hypothetical protein [Sphingomonas sp. PP-CC-3G-468]|uniref:hypothetical protein n=1 Tax=Sphingomonas sp. PP-CC-3G-468 TaxID=2135656 RepID=UPI00104714C7|nr:hypothetical protein [Sphingomonas sp. PP-CC-3G-468]TCM00202.1 hypothetical protein C8J41_1259 [Sphingomonas sp. PP-CC-3G-468]
MSDFSSLMLILERGRQVRKRTHTLLTNGAVLNAFAVVFVCTGGAAATPERSFNGRWRIDTVSLKGNVPPTTFVVTGGNFKRDGNEAVKADGQLYRVSGSGYVDEQSISIENDHVIKEVDKVRAQLAYTVEYVVSSDGNTLTWHVASFTSPSGQAVTSETVMRRIGPPTKGAHLITGRWERVSVTVDSNNDWIIKLDGKRFSWRTDVGTGYNATIGGKSVKIDGDNSGARAQITRPRPDTIVETDLSAKGRRDAVLTLQLMPDKNTIRATAVTLQKKTSTTFYVRRIP